MLRKALDQDRRVVRIVPLTRDRWSDLEQLFGERGACGGCWCMYWRLSRARFEKQKGAHNKQAFKTIVDRGEIPGLLAYKQNEPIAWCAVAPRENYPRLENSRILKRIDDKPVWSVVCLFVARSHRRRGVSTELLKAASNLVRESGGQILEGYPVEPNKGSIPDVFAWTGLASSFREAGFAECERRSGTRPIMRLTVRQA